MFVQYKEYIVSKFCPGVLPLAVSGESQEMQTLYFQHCRTEMKGYWLQETVTM